MDKDMLLKVAKQVREEGITTSATKDLMKKAQEIRLVSFIAAIKR
jgi:hypothetical protein